MIYINNKDGYNVFKWWSIMEHIWIFRFMQLLQVRNYTFYRSSFRVLVDFPAHKIYFSSNDYIISEFHLRWYKLITFGYIGINKNWKKEDFINLVLWRDVALVVCFGNEKPYETFYLEMNLFFTKNSITCNLKNLVCNFDNHFYN